ncbi:GNAT family N-acetyltransferase [Nocardioides sp. MAHUQ-72]|uniref:GNAT family N-acetyltransferase n=1 Tax=unclassified Nocardioides TaxID=2615069 RepID=UPI00361E084A
MSVPNDGLVIEPLDPHDVGAFDAFYDVYLAAERALGDIASPWMREEVRVSMQEQGASRWLGGFVGRAGGRVAVVGQLSTPLLDNRDSATLAVHVDPDRQRRGLGSAMLDRLEREARDRGRTLLNAEAVWGWPAGAEGAGEAGPEFARSRGFRLGLADVKRRLLLPVAAELLDTLAAEAARHHAAYTLRSWEGPVPDDLVEGWARLSGSLVTEAPTGEVEREPEHVDPAVVREAEDLLAKQGRRKYNTVALDRTGDVVAYTDVATTVHEPGRAYQWGTLVRTDARGHRLGLAVKVANLRLLQAARPDLTELTTYNAEVNRHMIGVNERLGFTPVAWLGEFQKRLC